MRIGVRRERAPEERRVALVPDEVAALREGGNELVIEPGAGAGAGYDDAEYAAAGALVGELVGCLAVACVRRPSADDAARLASGTLVVGLLDPLGDPEGVAELAQRGLTGAAMELVPRITRAQSMDALSSQATVAGYKAVLVAADRLPRMFPLLMTAAGTVKPARVLVLGAGVAGLQAIATARRLGGAVTAFDTRAVVREQVESLGARFLELDLGHGDAEGAGGYATELAEDAHRREQELVADAVADADVVITTAQIPGRPAPVLITAAAVARMRTGSVIVDLASDSGGNCELTVRGREIVAHGVSVIAAGDLPSRVPGHASALYARNVATLLRHLAPDGVLALELDDEITRAVVVCHAGEVLNEAVRERLGSERAAPEREL